MQLGFARGDCSFVGEGKLVLGAKQDDGRGPSCACGQKRSHALGDVLAWALVMHGRPCTEHVGETKRKIGPASWHGSEPRWCRTKLEKNRLRAHLFYLDLGLEFGPCSLATVGP